MHEMTFDIHPRGYLNKWLVLGSFPILRGDGSMPDEKARQTQRLEIMAPATNPLPLANDGSIRMAPPVQGQRMSWQGFAATWDLLDGGPDYGVALFDRFSISRNAVAYLYAQVDWPEPPAEFWVQIEKGVQIWVDGSPVGAFTASSAKIGQPSARASIPLAVPPGRHEILLKLWQGYVGGMNGWGLQLRPLNQLGQPMPETKVYLSFADVRAAKRARMQSEIQRDAITPRQVQAGEHFHVAWPTRLDGIDKVRVSVADRALDAGSSRPNGAAGRWELKGRELAGPLEAGLADRLLPVQVEWLDTAGEVLASAQRTIGVTAPPAVVTDPRRAVLQAILRQGEMRGRSYAAAATLIAGSAVGHMPDDPLAMVESSLAHIDARLDCADFCMLWLLRWRHLFGQTPQSEALRKAVDQRLRAFVYQPEDSTDHSMCMTTENHHALFLTCECLAGELMAKERFEVTGQMGQWHASRAAERLLWWIDDRMRYGYREFGCHYLMVDVDALCTLRDFSRNPTVVRQAERLLYKTLVLILNDAWRGLMVGSRARAYADELLYPYARRSGSDVLALLGDAEAQPYGDLFAMGIATATKPLPNWLRAGLVCANKPVTTWDQQGTQACRATRTLYRSEQVTLASARTPENYAKGQLLSWCATLISGTHIFTGHPGPCLESKHVRPNYWSGTRTHPHIGQYRSALLCVYTLPSDDPWGYSHAWWPVETFDEHIAQNNWFIARLGDGYVALRGLPWSELVQTGWYADQELIAPGQWSGWVCQVATRQTVGSFDRFVRQVCHAAVSLDGPVLMYDSPIEGPLRLNGDGTLWHENEQVTVDVNCHIAAPWATSSWGEGSFVVHTSAGVVRI